MTAEETFEKPKIAKLYTNLKTPNGVVLSSNSKPSMQLMRQLIPES